MVARVLLCPGRRPVRAEAAEVSPRWASGVSSRGRTDGRAFAGRLVAARRSVVGASTPSSCRSGSASGPRRAPSPASPAPAVTWPILREQTWDDVRCGTPGAAAGSCGCGVCGPGASASAGSCGAAGGRHGGHGGAWWPPPGVGRTRARTAGRGMPRVGVGAGKHWPARCADGFDQERHRRAGCLTGGWGRSSRRGCVRAGRPG